MIVELIRQSRTREEFMSHLFSRPVADFEKSRGPLTANNQIDFLRILPNDGLRNITRSALSHDADRAFSDVLIEHQRVSFRDASWRQGLTQLDSAKYYRYVSQLILPCEEQESQRN